MLDDYILRSVINPRSISNNNPSPPNPSVHFFGGRSAPSYVFQQNPKDPERERLDALEAVFDSFTQSNLRSLGLKKGWHCLEVGAGGGSITRWLCEEVGESGRVTAVDINPRFIEHFENKNLEILNADVSVAPIGHEKFDLIHTRFVLLHIPAREKALIHLIDALKPGGWMILEEPDFGSTRAVAGEREQMESADRVFEALRQLYKGELIDSFLGRKLPEIFHRLKLKGVGTHSSLELAPSKSNRMKVWRMAVEHLKEAFEKKKLLSEKDFQNFIRFSENPKSWMMDYLTVGMWGKK